MDELKKLIEERQYEKALSLTENTQEPEALFYRLSALLALNRSQDAMDLLEKHRQVLFSFNPKATIRTNFELRFLRKEFDQAYKDAEIFASFPYVSQEVEEMLRGLNDDIRANEKLIHGSTKLDDEELEELLLKSDDSMKVLGALNALKGKDLSQYADLIAATLSRDALHADVRTFALLLLVSSKDAAIRNFTLHGCQYSLQPCSLRPPFIGYPYEDIKTALEEEPIDPSVRGIALGLLDQTTLALYPRDLSNLGDPKTVAKAVSSLALSYLGQEGDCPEEAQKARSLIINILQKNPPLAF